MTERLYYEDSYLTRFTARVVEVAGDRVYLDRTAFYPTSGGQPFDLGTLGGALVVDVVDDGERIAHVVEGTLSEGTEVECAVDWTRRRDHMQQHTGQHLLSAVLEALYGIKTVSFHLGAESSTIDVDSLGLTAEQLTKLEERTNERIEENLAADVSHEDASAADGLRKPSERQGTLRIISIAGLDRSACGGTHVRATGEIGVLTIRKTEKIRNTTRIEFLCGLRAVRRARLDYSALSSAARVFSAPLDQVPALVESQASRLAEAGKARQKLEMELAIEAGRRLFASCLPSAKGVRLCVEAAAAIDANIRARAQGFVEGPNAVYLATSAAGPSYLLATSAGDGVNAAAWIKQATAELGGKGGGSATLAQGKVETAEGLNTLAANARREFGLDPAP